MKKASMEMPIDVPIRQLKKAKLATPVKPVKNWSFQSNSKSDQKNPNSAKLGDLVMSTARELDHPDYKTGKIDGAYIFFGIVRKYSQTTVPQRERIWVDWSQVEKGHTLIKSENKKILNRHEIEDDAIDLPAVLKHKVRIIAKCNNPHLDGVNTYLKLELLDEFYFIKPHGWRRIHESLTAD